MVNYIKEDVGCSTDGCDNWTSVQIPEEEKAKYDEAEFICGFCAAKEIAKMRKGGAIEQDTYAKKLVSTIREEKAVCAAIIGLVKAE